MRLWTSILITLLLVGLQGCDWSSFRLRLLNMTKPEAVDTALMERGITVYRNNYCGTCHTLTPAGARGMLATNHDDAGTVAEERIAAENYNGSATTAGEYLRESIVDPRAYIVPGYSVSPHQMPPFAHLPAEDIEALVYMLLQQRGSRA